MEGTAEWKPSWESILSSQWYQNTCKKRRQHARLLWPSHAFPLFCSCRAWRSCCHCACRSWISICLSHMETDEGNTTSGLRPWKGATPTSLLCKWSGNDALKPATSLHLSCFGTYFSLVTLSPLINLEIAWDTCQLPSRSYECLQVLLVFFILLLNGCQ